MPDMAINMAMAITVMLVRGHPFCQDLLKNKS